MIKNLKGTDYYASNLGLGCAFSNPVDNPKDIIKRAYDLGIRFFDTARVYNTEIFIGDLIKSGEINRNEIILSTKTKMKDRRKINWELSLSLGKLNTDYLDILFFHDGINSMEEYQTLKDSGIIECVKNKPFVRYIGISGHDIEAATAAINDGLINTIMVPHNIIYREFESVFELAEKKNVGVIPVKNLAGGVLTGGPKHSFGPGFIENILRFELFTKGVDFIIPSVRSIDQLEHTFFEYQNACSKGKLSDDEIKLILNVIHRRVDYICSDCQKCRPCKQFGWAMSQPNILRSLTYYANFSQKDKGLELYRKQKLNFGDCPTECSCDTKCPLGLPIKALMRCAKITLGGL